MSPEAARRAALVETGGVQQVRELTREAWSGHAFATFVRDVRCGCRSICTCAGFALVVVATLALVMGANATVFSVIHAVLWASTATSVASCKKRSRSARSIDDFGIRKASARDAVTWRFAVNDDKALRLWRWQWPPRRRPVRCTAVI